MVVMNVLCVGMYVFEKGSNPAELGGKCCGAELLQ
jgi:hypothetical protein